MAGVELADRLGGLGVGAFDDLRLVQHHQMPGQLLHGVDIAGEHGIGRDHDMDAGQLGTAHVAVQPVQHCDAKIWRELRQLRGPVGDQTGGHHDQRGSQQAAFRLFDDDMGDGLGGFAEPHIVSEKPAEPVRSADAEASRRHAVDKGAVSQ